MSVTLLFFCCVRNVCLFVLFWSFIVVCVSCCRILFDLCCFFFRDFCFLFCVFRLGGLVSCLRTVVVVVCCVCVCCSSVWLVFDVIVCSMCFNLRADACFVVLLFVEDVSLVLTLLCICVVVVSFV